MSKEEYISLFDHQPDSLFAHMEYDESFDYWAEGYRNSVNAQLQSIGQHWREQGYIDSAILPLMFSIHHFLELSLKSLYWECQKTIAVLNNTLPDINRNDKAGIASFDIHEQGHELPTLLNNLEDKLKKIDNVWFDKLEIGQLKIFINQLDDITPNGFAWRYRHPNTKKADEKGKKVFEEVRFLFRSLDYVTIEKIWEKIQLELKGITSLAEARPMDINFTNRGKGYWAEHELPDIKKTDET